MHIAFFSSTFAPIVDTEHRAAEPVAALAKALVAQGHAVTAVLPLLEGVDPLALGLARRLRPVVVDLDGEEQRLVVYEGRTPGGVGLALLDHEELLRERASLRPDGTAATDRALRLYAEAAWRWALGAEDVPRIVHAHDRAGLRAAAGRAALEGAPPLLWTVHDPCHVAPGACGRPTGDEPEGAAIVAALREAGRLVVPSTALAEALRRGGDGPSEPWAEALRETGAELLVVPHGLDEAVWNPSTDPLLEFHFDPVDLRGKARARAALQRRLELEVRADVPLVHADVAEGPATEALAEALPMGLRNEVQVVVTVAEGTPAEPLERLRRLRERFEERLRLVEDRSSRSLHRALAAADVRLLPEPWAPEATAALAAQRYGAVPVAARGTAHEDVVVDCDPSLRTGTGMLFDPSEPGALGAAMQRATAAWQAREAFVNLQRRLMRLDASWQRAAVRYERLYEAVTARGSREAPSEAAPLHP